MPVSKKRMRVLEDLFRLDYPRLYPERAQALRPLVLSFSPETTMKAGLRHLRFVTPMGPLLAFADSAGLCGLYFEDQKDCPSSGQSNADDADPILRQTRDQILDYFAGRLGAFSVPLSPAVTPFQQRVRDALLKVPAAHTTTYGALARSIDSPRGFRAVAQALARNPIIIIVPCHRVLASDGSLGGFSAGLARKPALLAHEVQHWPRTES